MAKNGDDNVKSGGSVTPPPPSLAYYDFYKTNGGTHVFYTTGPSLTRQEFAEECDINSIMKRYEGHNTGPGLLPNVGEPFYADFTEMPTDLMGYMELMMNAEKAFMTLNANVRKQFDNDPTAFVDFASDPANLEQMRTWGLAKPAEKPPEAPVPAPEAPPAPPSAQAPGGAPKPA